MPRHDPGYKRGNAGGSGYLAERRRSSGGGPGLIGDVDREARIQLGMRPRGPEANIERYEREIRQMRLAQNAYFEQSVLRRMRAIVRG